MTDALRAAITERLGQLAESQGVTQESREVRRVPSLRDKAEWRLPSHRSMPPVEPSTKPIPAAARDLEGRYADAPDHLAPEGMRSVARLCILSVAWGGFGNRTLRVTGRNVATKNVIITAVEDLTNISDEA